MIAADLTASRPGCLVLPAVRGRGHFSTRDVMTTFSIIFVAAFVALVVVIAVVLRTTVFRD
jgi:hypothetical protein